MIKLSKFVILKCINGKKIELNLIWCLDMCRLKIRDLFLLFFYLPARGECFLQAAPFDTPRKARHSGRAAKKNVPGRHSYTSEGGSNHAGIEFTLNCATNKNRTVSEKISTE